MAEPPRAKDGTADPQGAGGGATATAPGVAVAVAAATAQGIAGAVAAATAPDVAKEPQFFDAKLADDLVENGKWEELKDYLDGFLGNKISVHLGLRFTIFDAEVKLKALYNLPEAKNRYNDVEELLEDNPESQPFRPEDLRVRVKGLGEFLRIMSLQPHKRPSKFADKLTSIVTDTTVATQEAVKDYMRLYAPGKMRAQDLLHIPGDPLSKFYHSSEVCARRCMLCQWEPLGSYGLPSQKNHLLHLGTRKPCPRRTPHLIERISNEFKAEAQTSNSSSSQSSRSAKRKASHMGEIAEALYEGDEAGETNNQLLKRMAPGFTEIRKMFEGDNGSEVVKHCEEKERLIGLMYTKYLKSLGAGDLSSQEEIADECLEMMRVNSNSLKPLLQGSLPALEALRGVDCCISKLRCQLVWGKFGPDGPAAAAEENVDLLLDGTAAAADQETADTAVLKTKDPVTD